MYMDVNTQRLHNTGFITVRSIIRRETSRMPIKINKVTVKFRTENADSN